jgi:hypothetical protein
MSWNARRFTPGKPVLRAVRHRKKVVENSPRGSTATQNECTEAWMLAMELKLDRLAECLRLAMDYREVDAQRLSYKAAYLDEQKIVSQWQMKWLMERQKVRALETKIGSLRQARQLSRTRMRAGAFTTRATSRNSKR